MEEGNFESKIRRLYEDEDNPASFSGLLTFQKNLELTYNIKVSLKNLKKILSNNPTYLQFAKRVRKFPRRHYSIIGFASLWQSDLTEMNISDGFRYILIIIDAYTLFLVAKPLKNKTAETITSEFKLVFEEYGAPVCLETDAGGEFQNRKFQDFLEENHCRYHLKRPPLKMSFLNIFNLFFIFVFLKYAVFAECAIFHFKRKLFLMMHTANTKKWEHLVEKVTYNHNYSHHESLGNLRPIDLNSREKAVALYGKRKGLEEEPSFRDFEKNKQLYEKKGTIKEGDYVYLAVPSTSAPPKAGDFQVYGLPIQPIWLVCLAM